LILKRGVRATFVSGGAAPDRAGLGNPLPRRGELSSRVEKNFTRTARNYFRDARRFYLSARKPCRACGPCAAGCDTVVTSEKRDSRNERCSGCRIAGVDHETYERHEILNGGLGMVGWIWSAEYTEHTKETEFDGPRTGAFWADDPQSGIRNPQFRMPTEYTEHTEEGRSAKTRRRQRFARTGTRYGPRSERSEKPDIARIDANGIALG
jgi:hypothetical protein